MGGATHKVPFVKQIEKDGLLGSSILSGIVQSVSTSEFDSDNVGSSPTAAVKKYIGN